MWVVKSRLNGTIVFSSTSKPDARAHARNLNERYQTDIWIVREWEK